MSTFQERKAKSEAEGLGDAEAALDAMGELLDGLLGRKVLGVVFGVMYVDDDDAEIDREDLNGTQYSVEVASAVGGFPEALISIQDDITKHVIDKAREAGYSLEAQS